MKKKKKRLCEVEEEEEDDDERKGVVLSPEWKYSRYTYLANAVPRHIVMS